MRTAIAGLALSAAACVLWAPPTAAEAKHGASPPVSEILGWINDHFEPVKYTLTFRNAADGMVSMNITDDNYIRFHGCQVSIFERKTVITHFSDRGDGRYTDRDGTDGPLSLSSLRPDKIFVAPIKVPSDSPPLRYYRLSIWAASRFRWSHTDGGDPRFSWDKKVGALGFAFATQQMAKRQAKAWHDAIVACGGKVVPNNLY